MIYRMGTLLIFIGFLMFMAAVIGVILSIAFNLVWILVVALIAGAIGGVVFKVGWDY